ncbi:MAG: TonB-dependent receptor plug domain-containing protein, partial [Candidatus Kapaibacterium sp.]
ISLASFRGLPPEYTAVYWEGICITDPQHSFTDLGLIDLRSVQSVGIISAANAQLLGGDIGGAGILLSTNILSRESGLDIGTSLVSYNDLSSLGEKQLDLGGAYKISDNLSFAGGLNTAYSDGSFPFQQQVDSKPVSVNRENNDAHLLNANLAGDFLLDSTTTIKALSYFTRGERGAPGQITIDNRGASDFGARQYDENFLLALSVKHEPLSNFNYTLSAGYQTLYQTYTDTTYLDPKMRIADKYLNRIFSFGGKAKMNVTTFSDLYFGFDGIRDILYSNENFLASGDSIIVRNHYNAYLADKIEFSQNFDVTISLRSEVLSDVPKAQILPAASVHYFEANSLLTLEASYGRIYHAPTFNELYWKQVGNPNLLPENGSSAELSASIPVRIGNATLLQLQSTVFETDLKNQIIWQPGRNSINWTPSNVQQSRSQGIEFVGELQWKTSENYQLILHEGLSIVKTSNLTDSASYYGKELPYSTPMRSIFYVELQNSTIGALVFTTLYRGHRYTDYANNESTKLLAVWNYDLTFSSMPIHISSMMSASLRLSALNLTNVQYAEIPGYPLPGRMIKFGIDLTIK